MGHRRPGTLRARFAPHLLSQGAGRGIGVRHHVAQEPREPGGKMDGAAVRSRQFRRFGQAAGGEQVRSGRVARGDAGTGDGVLQGARDGTYRNERQEREQRVGGIREAGGCGA